MPFDIKWLLQLFNYRADTLDSKHSCLTKNIFVKRRSTFDLTQTAHPRSGSWTIQDYDHTNRISHLEKSVIYFCHYFGFLIDFIHTNNLGQVLLSNLYNEFVCDTYTLCAPTHKKWQSVLDYPVHIEYICIK